jgi:hypothetical protein
MANGEITSKADIEKYLKTTQYYKEAGTMVGETAEEAMSKLAEDLYGNMDELINFG